MTDYARAVVEIHDYTTNEETTHIVCVATLNEAVELAWKIESVLKRHNRGNCSTTAAWEHDA